MFAQPGVARRVVRFLLVAIMRRAVEFDRETMLRRRGNPRRSGRWEPAGGISTRPKRRRAATARASPRPASCRAEVCGRRRCGSPRRGRAWRSFAEAVRESKWGASFSRSREKAARRSRVDEGRCGLVGTSRRPSSAPGGPAATFSTSGRRGRPSLVENPMKQPWLKFFPSDWWADPALRMCSLAARGLWIEMLCLMHEARPHGSLLVSGRPVTAAQLANLVGGSVAEVEGFWPSWRRPACSAATPTARSIAGVCAATRSERRSTASTAGRAATRRLRRELTRRLTPGITHRLRRGLKPRARVQTPDARSRKQRRGDGRQARRDRGRLPRGAGRGRAGRCRDRADARRVERFGAERVCLALAAKPGASGGGRSRAGGCGRRSSRESPAEEPRALPRAPEEMAPLLNGESVPRAALMAAIERCNAGGDWPTSLGGLPAATAARCRKRFWRCASTRP